MISWPLLYLIIIADLAVILGAMAYTAYLPGYNRIMYMEGIRLHDQRRIKMEETPKLILSIGVILVLALFVTFIIGIVVPDSDSVAIEELTCANTITVMKDGTSFVITTDECVWIYQSDEVTEVTLGLKVLAKGMDYYRNPRLAVKSNANLLGESLIKNRLVLIMDTPNEIHTMADPVMYIQTE